MFRFRKMSVGHSSGIASSSITSDDNALIAKGDLSVASSPVPNKEKVICKLIR